MEFVKLKDAEMSADQAKKLSDDELCQIPEIATQIKDGEKQVKEYGNLRLQKFVAVALGFERVCFRLVNGVGS